MDPIKAAEQTVPLIERGGVVAAVIICSALIVCGLMAAIVVLWRKGEATLAHTQTREEEHSKLLIDMVVKNSDLNHQLAATLKGHEDAIKANNDRMQAIQTSLAVISERVARP
jgi:hypothetical protein